MADKRLLRYDPISGLATYHAEEDGKDITAYEQDIEPTLEWCQQLRNDPDVWKTGVKKGMAHYATVPAAIITKMWAEDGVNFYDKHQKDKVFHLLNTKYAFCKVTTKHHEVK